ncbi:MAG: PepSY-associated TM helix domain-containing protein [Lentimicrobiaceae bacterium]|nr:PepSY-associated TM helix domain-containing protein [Lentimicrobiaceae bacterium]
MKYNYRKLLRDWHRDLGYLFVGLTCIYSISGIVLNYKQDGQDPAYKEIVIESTLPSGLSVEEFKQEWTERYSNQVTLNRVIPSTSQYKLFLNGGMGSYDVDNGSLESVYYKEITSLKFMNEIHYNSGKRFTWMSNIFAGSLIFLAISGAIILKGKNGFKRRGVWLMLAGVVLPFVWYWLS